MLRRPDRHNPYVGYMWRGRAPHVCSSPMCVCVLIKPTLHPTPAPRAAQADPLTSYVSVPRADDEWILV